MKMMRFWCGVWVCALTNALVARTTNHALLTSGIDAL